ncbi:exported protein of unknown function [Hyphomicrobium sp. 1Nfss2.1]|uniref:hypothetical protein n=1 Tax=Hyphomicrobium sp. 1Nfss2.1 TaxID=3413936 RepID=UPI003C7D6BDF
MPICSLRALACVLAVISAEPALAEWHYLVPGEGDQDVHRAFAFAEKGDDRLEFACNSKRRDLFYSTAQTVSKPELNKLQGGKPTIIVRLDGIGAVPLDADHAYQKGGRLFFVTAVTPAFIADLGKAREPVAAGMQANGKIVQQGEFTADGLKAALESLAAGCRF